MTARRKDPAAWGRVRQLLTGDQSAFWQARSHIELAVGSVTTVNVVRAVRRELGHTRVAPVTPIGARLLRGMDPRNVTMLRRLAAAVDSGSDMRVRAVLATPGAKQLLDAARRMG